MGTEIVQVRSAGGLNQAGRRASMEKWLCWGALGAAGLMALLFLLDLLAKFPFGGASKVLDIFGILAAGLVGYLAWDTMRELR